MFTRPTDTNKATIYSVLVLLMALVVAVLIRFLDLTPIINLIIQVVIPMFTVSRGRDRNARLSWQDQRRGTPEEGRAVRERRLGQL
jgi:hypothetical protein